MQPKCFLFTPPTCLVITVELKSFGKLLYGQGCQCFLLRCNSSCKVTPLVANKLNSHFSPQLQVILGVRTCCPARIHLHATLSATAGRGEATTLPNCRLLQQIVSNHKIKSISCDCIEFSYSMGTVFNRPTSLLIRPFLCTDASVRCSSSDLLVRTRQLGRFNGLPNTTIIFK